MIDCIVLQVSPCVGGLIWQNNNLPTKSIAQCTNSVSQSVVLRYFRGRLGGGWQNTVLNQTSCSGFDPINQGLITFSQRTPYQWRIEVGAEWAVLFEQHVFCYFGGGQRVFPLLWGRQHWLRGAKATAPGIKSFSFATAPYWKRSSDSQSVELPQPGTCLPHMISLQVASNRGLNNAREKRMHQNNITLRKVEYIMYDTSPQRSKRKGSQFLQLLNDGVPIV